ncbi:MAG: pyridoxamine 5'-phosphate oxidase family protein [bacterium]|nr:pyridoxamine 5'-phosphate oxidase family protein [bacterium]
MELRTLIKNYLQEARIMQVTTSLDNQPWACTVYLAFDESLNLYWISTPSRRHSEEIRSNEKVAGTIVLPHTPGDKVRGLQFQGIAKELASPEESTKGMKFYGERMGMSGERIAKVVDGSDGHFCYRIKPTLFVLFDEVNFPEDSRQEYRI